MKKTPKRRKSCDNPYTIEFSEEKNIYTITFKDAMGTVHCVEVKEDIFNFFNKNELEDISQMHKFERHIEHSELTENSINKRAFNRETNIDEYLISKLEIENLRTAINKLPEIQRKRIKLYFFENMNIDKIAEIEKCTHQAISCSLKIALKNLKKFLN